MSFIEEFFKSMARVLGRIIVYIILGFIMFYIINDKVNASSYSWSQPTMMSFHTTRGNFTSLKSCTGVNECFYSENGDMVANFASARYQFSRSLTDASQYAEQNTYSLSVRFRIVTLDEISKSNTNVTMYYYPDNSNNYSLATCDGTQELTISKNADYDYYVTYKCNEFTINRDISHMGLMIGGYPNSIYFVQMAQNLQLIGPGEASNDDIINNQNQNTQDIINNQNQNQNQTNEGLQDIEDAILDDSQPNLDNFNYTDSTGGLISTFLTMPITLLRVMNNVETCRSITLGELFGSPLRLDCINPQVFLGETLWKIIDYFIVFNMITSISQLFVYVYEKFKNLDDFFNEFYTPQHIGPDEYVPRHGGGS